MYKIVLKATKMAQNFVKAVLNDDDVAVDATLGNGNDTIFLSNQLPMGRVYAFEIQKNAVDKFNMFLNKNNINNITVIHDGHENMKKYINESPAAIMFNLGYLPGGDEKIITKPDTTLKAIEDAMEILKPGGIITIAVYTGHEGGKEEGETIEDYVKGINPKQFSTMTIKFTNRANSAPFLIVIEKNDNCDANK